MGKVIDKNGREYRYELTVGDVLRIKRDSEGRYNLFEPESEIAPGLPLLRITQDAFEDFFEVLWRLVEPTAVGMTCEQFGASLPPASLVKAQRQFSEEWTDFFRQLQREDKAFTLEKIRLFQAMAAEKIKTLRGAAELQEIDAKVAAKMDKVLKNSLGDLQASLD